MVMCPYEYSNHVAKANYSTRFECVEAMPSVIQTGVRMAKTASRNFTSGYYCVGACAITKNNFITGNCSKRTHPLQKKFAGKYEHKLTLHAEFDVLTKIKGDVDINCMVVVRTSKVKEEFASSKPCDICLAAMMAYDVKSIVFFEDNLWHKVELFD